MMDRSLDDEVFKARTSHKCLLLFASAFYALKRYLLLSFKHNIVIYFSITLFRHILLKQFNIYNIV